MRIILLSPRIRHRQLIATAVIVSGAVVFSSGQSLAQTAGQPQSSIPQATSPQPAAPTQTPGAANVSYGGQGQCGCSDNSQASAQVSALITQSAGNAQQACAAVTPIITANPCAAAGLIGAATQGAKISDGLAQCLANIQKGLKSTIPAAAKSIEKVVTCAPPVFQAAYAEALAPTDPAPTQTASAGGNDGGGTGSGGSSSGGSSAASSGGGASGGGFGTLGGGSGGFGANNFTSSSTEDVVSPH